MISIHALLTESDLNQIAPRRFHYHFYPRSPYGERRVTVLGIQHRVGISIHALLTESDRTQTQKHLISQAISIHALLTESDDAIADNGKTFKQFLSTLSLRRATVLGADRPPGGVISIHALLTESDVNAIKLAGPVLFLSTLSLRRATAVHNAKIDKHDDFYPRSPYGERRRYPARCVGLLYFYPRSPYGERRVVREPATGRNNKFLSTLSLRRATYPLR